MQKLSKSTLLTLALVAVQMDMDVDIILELSKYMNHSCSLTMHKRIKLKLDVKQFVWCFFHNQTYPIQKVCHMCFRELIFLSSCLFYFALLAITKTMAQQLKEESVYFSLKLTINQ